MPAETAKLCPLARTDLCAWVKGLQDKLITCLGLGSSMEEPWGLFALLLLGEVLPPWELMLLDWWVVLFSWGAWNDLTECLLPLPGLLPACLLLLLVGGLACASWEPALLVIWKTPLSTWEIALSAWEVWEALCLVEHLTAWEELLLAGETLLSTWGIVLSVWKVVNLLPAWDLVIPKLPSWEIVLLMLPSLEGML